MTLTDKTKMVHEFHQTYDAYIGNCSQLPNNDIRKLRVDLLREEFEEYLKGEEKDDLIEIADALGDMLYIIYGTSIAYGIPIDAIFEEIHRSNMSKLGQDGKPLRREDGKILKGPNYFRPNILKVINSHTKSNDR